MVIVIMGASGAGKTTIGRALAVELGWRYVEGDEAHPARNIEKTHEGVPLTDADRKPWLAALHNVIARSLDRREHAVVACSALKARYRDALRGDRHPVRFVYLGASAEVLRRRLEARAAHFFNPALLQDQLATLEQPHPADTLILDACAPPEQILSAIRHEFGV
jgi:gluconokinase